MGPLPSSTCGFQDLPDHGSSQQKGSDVEEHDMKGLDGPGLRATCVATKSQFEKLEVWCVVCVCAHVRVDKKSGNSLLPFILNLKPSSQNEVRSLQKEMSLRAFSLCLLEPYIIPV